MKREPAQHRAVELPAERPLRIAVAADSHSRPHPAAAGLIAAERPAFILHAGDIGNLAVLDQLAEIAPVYAVRGNIDGHDPRTPDDLVLTLVAGDTRLLTILLTHIAVYGPRLRKPERELARSHGANLVVCGHSHVPLIAEERGVVVFNPGSFGPRRFHLPITFGVIDIGDKGLGLRHVDCETGSRWMPPA